MIKSCLKELSKLGANHIIHNVSFLGAAIDRLDREKTKFLWANILSTVLPGEIKNVYTSYDWILLYYSMCEHEKSQGRNKIYFEPYVEEQRTNLLADYGRVGHLPAVASPEEHVFRLRNYNIKGLGTSSIGHLAYRDCLRSILFYIRFYV